jgi:sialate O-acetylesterase
MAVIFDAGEARDIHPLDKKTPGKRLAAQALAKIYGKDIPCESPMATHAEKSAGAVTIHFANTYGSLVATEVPALQHVHKASGKTAPLVRTSPNAQLEGFVLCNRDGQWFWADKAEITGKNTVKVSSTAVPDPVKIRYCWSNNPTCNLFNRAGFPAAPFEFILK